MLFQFEKKSADPKGKVEVEKRVKVCMDATSVEFTFEYDKRSDETCSNIPLYYEYELSEKDFTEVQEIAKRNNSEAIITTSEEFEVFADKLKDHQKKCKKELIKGEFFVIGNKIYNYFMANNFLFVNITETE